MKQLRRNMTQGKATRKKKKKKKGKAVYHPTKSFLPPRQCH
jgi:hypothetical protein